MLARLGSASSSARERRSLAEAFPGAIDAEALAAEVGLGERAFGVRAVNALRSALDGLSL